MPKNTSIRAQAKVVIYLDPETKVRLKSALRQRKQTLKAWFGDMVSKHLLADDLFEQAKRRGEAEDK